MISLIFGDLTTCVSTTRIRTSAWSTDALTSAPANVIVRQRMQSGAADETREPTLVDGVTHVIGVRSNKEMRRIDTPSNVARMTDQQAARDRSFVRHVHEAVDEHSCSPSFRVPTTTLSVALMDRTRPQPAAARTFDDAGHHVFNRQDRSEVSCLMSHGMSLP